MRVTPTHRTRGSKAISSCPCCSLWTNTKHKRCCPASSICLPSLMTFTSPTSGSWKGRAGNKSRCSNVSRGSKTPRLLSLFSSCEVRQGPIIEDSSTRPNGGFCEASRRRSAEVSAHDSGEHLQLLMKPKSSPRWPCLQEVWGSRVHPPTAELMIRHLEDGTAPCFQAVRQCRDSVTAAGLVVPCWTELSLTPPEDLEEAEPNQPRHGWQQESHPDSWRQDSPPVWCGGP